MHAPGAEATVWGEQGRRERRLAARQAADPTPRRLAEALLHPPCYACRTHPTCLQCLCSSHSTSCRRPSAPTRPACRCPETICLLAAAVAHAGTVPLIALHLPPCHPRTTTNSASSSRCLATCFCARAAARRTCATRTAISVSGGRAGRRGRGRVGGRGGCRGRVEGRAWPAGRRLSHPAKDHLSAPPCLQAYFSTTTTTSAACHASSSPARPTPAWATRGHGEQAAARAAGRDASAGGQQRTASAPAAVPPLARLAVR